MACGAAAVPREEPPLHRFLVFGIVGMALLMSSLDGTIVATALHAIQRGLHTSINWTSWVITGYSVGVVLVLSLAGTASERFGRRRFFLFSVAVFAGASLCCGLASNIYLLIGLRALQAAGGAGFTPSATAIVVDTFGTSRDKALGLFGSIFPIGSLVGPIFGGLFVAYWTWRGIFFVNVPIGVALVLLCLKFVPKDDGRRVGDVRPLDLAGMTLLGTGILATMVGVTELGEAGARASSPLFVVPLAIGAVALVQFGRHIRRVSNPFILPRFIGGRGFGAVNAVNFVFGGLTYGLVTLVPLYAIDRYRVDALGSGTLLAGEGVTAIVTATLAAVALRKTGYRLPLYLGSVMTAIGLGALALPAPGLSAYAWLAIACCIVGVGFGVSSPASRNAGLQLAPDHSASLAAMRSTGLQLGSIVAIAVTTALLAHAAHPGRVQAVVFLASAAMLVPFLPIISRVPEHRGSW